MAIKRTEADGAAIELHPQWEYSIVSRTKAEMQYKGMPFGVFLDLHGSEGWELVAVDGPHFYFKRKKYKPRGRKKAS